MTREGGPTPYCSCDKCDVDDVERLVTLINHGVPQWEASRMLWSPDRPPLVPRGVPAVEAIRTMVATALDRRS